MVTKFDKIYELVTSDEFLNNLSTGGEIPFYLITYDVQKENDLTENIDLLKRRIKNDGKKTLVIDLYDHLLKCLTLDDELKVYFELEQESSKKDFTRTINLAANIDKSYIPLIGALIDEEKPDLVLMKGVGKVFPFIRSHTIVNNLENIIKIIPIVLFYPGTYSGTQLSLFGRIKSENHYRAINIQDIQLYQKKITQ